MLLVSMLTAAYGAWPFDLVLLLVPVLQVAVSPRSLKLAVLLHAAINGAALILIACRVEFFWFVWMSPALLLGYLITRRTGSLRGDGREENPGFQSDFS